MFDLDNVSKKEKYLINKWAFIDWGIEIFDTEIVEDRWWIFSRKETNVKLKSKFINKLIPLSYALERQHNWMMKHNSCFCEQILYEHLDATSPEEAMKIIAQFILNSEFIYNKYQIMFSSFINGNLKKLNFTKKHGYSFSEEV